MENPITARDIIDEQGIVQSLRTVQEQIGMLRESLKEKAGEIKITINGGADATAFVAQINAIAGAMDKLGDFEKINKDYESAVKKAASLAKEEAKYRAQSNKELQKHSEQQEINAKVTKLLNGELETSKLSYNELSAIYSAMSSRLKNLSKEQIESMGGMKQFAAITKQVRDGMNEAQKAIGNYSLNVGKYHTAFDGLGFSIQQVLREVPSATNISQFFLAISNNIPMVVDQIKMFNEEQENIKKQLGELTEGTKEYMEIQSKQMSLGQKLVKSIFSWQTAILAALLLLRKLPEIIEKINNKMKDAVQWLKIYRELNEEAASEVGSLTAKFEGLRKEWNSLDEKQKIEWLKQHTDAAKDLGMELNNVNDAEKLFNGNTGELQESIDKRARSIASMSMAAKRYEEAFKKISEAEIIEQDPWASVGLWDFAKGMMGNYRGESGAKDIEEEMANRARKLREEGERLQKEASEIIKKYYIPLPQEDDKKGGKEDDKKGGKGGSQSSEPTYQDAADRYWEAMQARLEVLSEGYTKELELARLANAKALEENEIAFDNQVTQLDENLRNKLMKQEEYNAHMLAARQQHDTIELSLQTQLANMERELMLKHNKELTEEAVKRTEVTLRESKRRIRTVTEEGARNEQVMLNINDLQVRLIQLEEQKANVLEGGEEIIRKAIEETNQALEKQRNLLGFDKQIGELKFQDFGQMIGDKVKSGASMDSAIKILGALGFNEEQLEAAGEATVMGVFEKMIDVEMDNLKKWYDLTSDYINDAISAWQDLSQAKIDAAQEDVAMAEEAYENEKALLEAGYANRMESAYAELEEKRKIQKQAEEDAAKSQKAQQAIDMAQQVSSLVTGIANIWRSFSTLPVVAAALTAAMLAGFTASRAAAIDAAKKAQYGDGGYEPVFGGSHASGTDVELNMNNRDGRRMVVEGGEGVGVFRRRAVSYYGNNGIESIVDAVNRCEFERGNIELLRRRGELVNGMAESRRPGVSLGVVEGTLGEIARQGRERMMVDAEGNVIEIRRNGTTKYIRR